MKRNDLETDFIFRAINLTASWLPHILFNMPTSIFKQSLCFLQVAEILAGFGHLFSYTGLTHLLSFPTVAMQCAARQESCAIFLGSRV